MVVTHSHLWRSYNHIVLSPRIVFVCFVGLFRFYLLWTTCLAKFANFQYGLFLFLTDANMSQIHIHGIRVRYFGSFFEKTLRYSIFSGVKYRYTWTCNLIIKTKYHFFLKLNCLMLKINTWNLNVNPFLHTGPI
jgi:hypothetical protein